MLSAALLHLFDCGWDVASEVGRLPRDNRRDCHVHTPSIAHRRENCDCGDLVNGLMRSVTRTRRRACPSSLPGSDVSGASWHRPFRASNSSHLIGVHCNDRDCLAIRGEFNHIDVWVAMHIDNRAGRAFAQSTIREIGCEHNTFEFIEHRAILLGVRGMP